MKNTIKILLLCVVMVLGMSFSAFSASKTTSSLRLKNGTVIKIEKTLDGKLKSIQFLNGEKVELKNIQSMFNSAMTKCLRMADGASDACTNAKIVASLAVAAALAACATGNPVVCAIASAVAINAIRLMKEACGGIVAVEEQEARNRKFLILKKNKFQFQT